MTMLSPTLDVIVQKSQKLQQTVEAEEETNSIADQIRRTAKNNGGW